jgi:hypothetical protein
MWFFLPQIKVFITHHFSKVFASELQLLILLPPPKQQQQQQQQIIILLLYFAFKETVIILCEVNEYFSINGPIVKRIEIVMNDSLPSVRLSWF